MTIVRFLLSAGVAAMFTLTTYGAILVYILPINGAVPPPAASVEFGACDMVEMGAYVDQGTAMYLELGCRLEKITDQMVVYTNMTETLGRCGFGGFAATLARFDQTTHDVYKLFFGPDDAAVEWKADRARERERLVDSLLTRLHHTQKAIPCPMYTALSNRRNALCLAFAGTSKVSWEALKVGRRLRAAHCPPLV
jgi:hypothetical protein